MLGLLASTDARWASVALADLDEVLRDHAHCEMKAATNAISLAARHPDDLALVRKLVALAQEELAHFDRVLALLEARGVALGPTPVDEYVAQLRAAATSSLLDRLLVGALIEARSCERFKLLADEMGESHELFPLYTVLFAAEARHHRELVSLATAATNEAVASARLRELAVIEAEIVRSLPTRATMHG